MLHSQRKSKKLLCMGEFFYLFLVGLSFYLLLASRAGEAHTIWEVLHPLFIPIFFIATILLFAILFTSEKVSYILLFIIVHSILLHSLFSILFPAGDLSGQQMILGRTRLVFDNTVIHGWPPWPPKTIQTQIYQWFGEINSQAAVSTVFARMFSLDIFWVHMFLVPALWGVLVPIAAFLTTKILSENEKAAAFSSLLVSAFPYTIYFGAISVPNSLGFIFFFYALYFSMKYLTIDSPRNTAWMLVFSFFSFLSHNLTGVVSFSLVVLAFAFKTSMKEDRGSSTTAKIWMFVAFLVCTSLLPLSFTYLQLFLPGSHVIFSLDKFYESSTGEIVGLLLIGELIHFDLKTRILVITGPLLGLLWMIYLSYKLKKGQPTKFGICTLFLFAAFFMMLIDYRILKLFMVGLPINEERLWVFRDFIAAPFVALAIYAVVSSIKAFLEAKSPSIIPISGLKVFSNANVFSLSLIINILVSLLLGGWITASLSVAYPQVAPLQTTWYELEAAKYIEENTKEKYVVIGDVWTIFAGEMIVGIQNPGAYYFGENDPRAYDLFAKMRKDPSPQVLVEAMNQTGADTKVAYLIVTEPRLGTEEFNQVVSRVLENGQLTVMGIFGDGKLYVFSYRKE